MSSSEIFRTVLESIEMHPAITTQVVACGFTVQFLVGQTLAGHYDGLVTRAERWLRGGTLRSGFGTFQGRVVSLHDRGADVGLTPEARNAAAIRRPVVEHKRTQREIRKDLWKDVHVASRFEPFRLALPEDAEIEVQPGTPRLAGFEETERLPGSTLREVKEIVYPEETVWVTGYLEPAPKSLGAYRGGATIRRVRAPRGKQLWITRQAPANEWRKLARAHRVSGFTALACMGLSGLVAWKKVLVPLAQLGPAAAPRMPGAVLVIWAVLIGLSLVVWGRSVRQARHAWARRFSWM